MDCSLPGSFVHRIFQARVLEWGAIAFSRLHIRYLANVKSICEMWVIKVKTWLHFVNLAIINFKVKVTQSCLTLCEPHGLYSPWTCSGQNTGVGSLPLGDLPNPGIEAVSLTLQVDSLPAEPQGKLKNTGVGSLSLFQRIFPTKGLNPHLPHCWQILYQLSNKGSPRILEWVAYPFSSGPSWPSNPTGVSCTRGGFFPSWTISGYLLFYVCW